MSATTSWEQVSEDSLAAMSEAERAEYDAAAIEAEARLQLAELVYGARTAAGLSQTELARRACHVDSCRVGRYSWSRERSGNWSRMFGLWFANVWSG